MRNQHTVNSYPAYTPEAFEGVRRILEDRLDQFPMSRGFLGSLGDGTSESAEILVLILTYMRSK